jgi:hypothetical protein
MYVKDFLAGTGTVIEHQPKGIGNPFLNCNPVCHQHEMPQKLLIGSYCIV